MSSYENFNTSEVDSIRSPKDVEIEELKQAVHSLNLKLSNQYRMRNCLESDIEQLKKEGENQKQKLISELKSNDIELNNKIVNQQLEIERLNEQYFNLNSELDCAKKLLNSHKSGSKNLMDAGIEVEVSVYDLLKSQIEELSMDKDSLLDKTDKLMKKVKEHDECDKKLMKLQCLIGDFKIEIENLNQEISSKDLMIDNMKEEITGIQAQLDAEKMIKALPLKGNSLFAEVEDRRVVVENELLKFRKENDELKLELMVCKQASLQLKDQLSSKWANDAEMVDEKIYKSLEIDYHNICEENKNLQNNLIQLTKETNNDYGMEIDKILVNEAYKPYMKTLHYLESSIKDKSNELNKIRTQLVESMTLNSSLKYEINQLKAKLHSLEFDLTKLHASQVQLKLINEQLKFKYEQEAYNDQKGIEKLRLTNESAVANLELLDPCMKNENIVINSTCDENSKICNNIFIETSNSIKQDNSKVKSYKSALINDNLEYLDTCFNIDSAEELFNKRRAEKFLYLNQSGERLNIKINNKQTLSENNDTKSSYIFDGEPCKKNINNMSNQFLNISTKSEHLISENLIKRNNDCQIKLKDTQKEISNYLANDSINDIKSIVVTDNEYLNMSYLSDPYSLGRNLKSRDDQLIKDYYLKNSQKENLSSSDKLFSEYGSVENNLSKVINLNKDDSLYTDSEKLVKTATNPNREKEEIYKKSVRFAEPKDCEDENHKQFGQGFKNGSQRIPIKYIELTCEDEAKSECKTQ